jgi:methyl-accepting chemotaxis protein
MERLERAADRLRALCDAKAPERVVMCFDPGPPRRTIAYLMGRFPKGEAVVEVLAAEGLDVRQVWWLDGWPAGVSDIIRFDAVRAGSEALMSAHDNEALLREGLKSLAEARTLAEGSIVSVTRRLNDIVGIAREHGQALSEVAGDYHRARAEAPSLVAAVGDLVESLSKFRATVTEELHNHAFLVRGAVQSVAALRRLTETISEFAEASRMATFNARIEAARIGAQGHGFVAIANSLQQLARDVRFANSTAQNIARQLGSGLPQVEASTTSLSAHVEAQLQALTAHVNSVKQRIANNRATAEEELDRATKRAGHLKAQTNQVLGEIQFQDRTSQLMEAVQMTIAGVLEGLTDDQIQEIHRRAKSLREPDPGAAGSVELF